MEYLLEYSIHVASQETLERALDSVIYLIDIFYFAAHTRTIEKLNMVNLLDRLTLEARCSEELRAIPASSWPQVIDGLCVRQFVMIKSRFSFLRDMHAEVNSGNRSYDISSHAASYGILPYVDYKIERRLPLSIVGRIPLLHSAVYGVSLPDPWRRALREAKALNMIQFLMRKGADPKTRHEGATPLGVLIIVIYWKGAYGSSHAIWRVIFECGRALLEGGADPNAPIIRKGKYDRSLLSTGIRLSPSGTGLGQSPSARECFPKLLTMLMESGADCNQKDGDGFRPLFSALKYGDWVFVEALLQYGADPSDLGNGKNALVPQTCEQPPSLFENVQHLQPLLHSYKGKSLQEGLELGKPGGNSEAPEGTPHFYLSLEYSGLYTYEK